jgi:UDP-glucose 4-epimerase
VRKYGFASSAYVYSLHGSFYRISKRTCEEYIHEYSRRYGIPYVIFRYGSLYGGDSDASNGVHRMVTSALFDGVVRYRGGTSDSREYIHVKDASRISADLMLGDAVNQAFLLTGAERITIGQFFEMLSEILDKPLRFEGNNGASGDHYRMTQYNFAPIEAHKIHLLEHIDLGNGLLELIQRLYGNANKAGDAAPHVAPLETLV